MCSRRLGHPADNRCLTFLGQHVNLHSLLLLLLGQGRDHGAVLCSAADYRGDRNFPFPSRHAPFKKI